MKITCDNVDAELARELACGDPRSPEYKAGVRAAVYRRLDGTRANCPYPAGSVQFDAWFAGHDRGRDLWREGPGMDDLADAAERADRES